MICLAYAQIFVKNQTRYASKKCAALNCTNKTTNIKHTTVLTDRGD